MIMRHVLLLTFYAFLCSCKISAQEKDIEKYLQKNIEHLSKSDIQTEIIKNKGCLFTPPIGTNDTLVAVCRKYFLKDYTKTKKYCEQGCKIETEYLIESYVRSGFISVLQKQFYECPTMPSPSISSKGINLLLYNGVIYEVQVSWNKKTQSYLDSLLQKKFDTECIENGSVNEDLDLFIKNGKFFINNPLHSKVCDEPLELPGVFGKLKFIKVKY
jgi:hypothetical protein